MKRLPAVLLVCCLALPGLAGAAEEEATPYRRAPAWQTLREAEALSRAEQKPLLIHFGAPWSGDCRKMHRETYGDPGIVRYLNEHFALAEIDTDRLPAMARKFQVKGLPTLWFLDETGRRLTRLDGFVSAGNLQPLLEFIVARDYEWTDYATWRERRR